MSNRRELTFVKPGRLVWTDKVIRKVLALTKQGYSYSQIEKKIDLSNKTIKQKLSELRQSPKWRGKIPYIKIIPKSVERKLMCVEVEQKREHHVKKERIGFLDIESSGLNPVYSVMLCYRIKKLDGEILKREIKVSDLQKEVYDKNLVKQFIEDCGQFDRLITHYGIDRKFDLPYLRTKAVHYKLSGFPEYKFMYVSDTHPILKNKFHFDRNTLKAACEYFGIPSKLTPIRPEYALRLYSCNPKLVLSTLKKYGKHCDEDVISLESLWKQIYKYSNFANTSI